MKHEDYVKYTHSMVRLPFLVYVGVYVCEFYHRDFVECGFREHFGENRVDKRLAKVKRDVQVKKDVNIASFYGELACFYKFINEQLPKFCVWRMNIFRYIAI